MGSDSDTKMSFDVKQAGMAGVAALVGMSAASYMSVGGLNIGTPQLAAAAAAGVVFSYVKVSNLAQAAVFTTDPAALAKGLAASLQKANMMSAAEAGLAAGAVLVAGFGYQMTDAAIFGASAAAAVYLGNSYSQ